MGRDKPPVIAALRRTAPEGEPLVIGVDGYEVLAYKDANGIRVWSLKRPKRVESGVVLEYQTMEPSEELRSPTFHTIPEIQDAVRKTLKTLFSR